MTDDEPDPTDDEQLDDVDDALEAAGFAEADDETEPEADDGGRLSGMADKLGEITGTGKSLDSYDNDPVAAVFTPDGADTPRGAKHIARGVDGLSPLAAAHPFVDIAVGFVLLKAEGKIEGSPVSEAKSPTDPPDDDGDDSHYRGDMT